MIHSKIHIGEEIQKVLFERKINKAKLARLMEVKPQSVDYLLKRKSIDTDTLYKISRLLDYDFSIFFRLHQANYEQRFFDIEPIRAKVLVELDLQHEDIELLNLRSRILDTAQGNL